MTAALIYAAAAAGGATFWFGLAVLADWLRRRNRSAFRQQWRDARGGRL